MGKNICFSVVLKCNRCQYPVSVYIAPNVKPRIEYFTFKDLTVIASSAKMWETVAKGQQCHKGYHKTHESGIGNPVFAAWPDLDIRSLAHWLKRLPGHHGFPHSLTCQSYEEEKAFSREEKNGPLITITALPALGICSHLEDCAGIETHVMLSCEC